MLVFLARCLIGLIEIVQSCLGQGHADTINDDVKKFTHVVECDFDGDFGKVKRAFRTVPYRVWMLQTESHELIGADKHIVVMEDGREVWIEDLRIGDRIRTESGIESIRFVTDLGVSANMYDIEVDHPTHHYYANGVLSHNTTTASAYLLWVAIFHPNQRILVLSKDHDGAKEIMDRLWFAYEELPWWLKPGVTRNQVHTKNFDNGSEIKALATTKGSGRGKSVTLLYIDEFAFIAPNLANELWASVYPTLTMTGGRCIITSTPNTDEDKFAKLWFGAKPLEYSTKWEDVYAKKNAQYVEEKPEVYETEFATKKVKEEYEDEKDSMVSTISDDEKVGFRSFFAHWNEVPEDFYPDGKVKSYRGDAYKRAMMKSGFTPEIFAREFDCSFVTGDETLISAERLAVLKYGVREPRYIDKWGCRWFDPVEPNMAYAVVMDPSEGVGLDDSVIQVWEVPTMRQIAEWSSNKFSQPDQTKMLRRILKRIFLMQQEHPDHDGSVNIYFSVERNGQGIGIINAIEYEGPETFPGHFIDASPTSIHVKGSAGGYDKPHRWRGLWTSNASKRRYALEFAQLVERRLFVPRSAKLVSQLKTFVKTGMVGFHAKPGTKDDVVMSCIIMTHLLDELRYQEPELDDLIRPGTLDDYDEDNYEHVDNQGYLPVV